MSNYIETIRCMCHLYKHIFSTVSKGIVARFVSFGLSPSTTLCTITCVLRFRALTKGVEVTRHNCVVLLGNILGASRFRGNRGKFVCMGHRIPDYAVEVITVNYEMRFSHGLLESIHLCLCVRVSVKRYRGNTHAGCFMDCKVHTHCRNLLDLVEGRGQPSASSVSSSLGLSAICLRSIASV